MLTDHDEIIRAFHEKLRSIPLPEGTQLEIPPKCSREVETRWVEYLPGERLRAEFVIPDKYSNALGYIQGGFLCALFDNVIGPLSYAAAGPTTSIDLTTNFLRHVTAGETIAVEARIRRAGRRAIHITAEATNREGKLVATSISNIIPLL